MSFKAANWGKGHHFFLNGKIVQTMGDGVKGEGEERAEVDRVLEALVN